MGKIGITTSVPVEAIFAAGHVPVDLNNVFITSPDRKKYLDKAESAGLPATTCAWIKGIYGAASECGVEAVVGVLGGDCSNTRALTEIWRYEGLETIPFAYPYERTRAELSRELERFCAHLGTTVEAAEEWKTLLDAPRALAREIDLITWRDGLVTGRENHLQLVSASDFNGDPEAYAKGARAFISEARARAPMNQDIRLGYIGVPTILDGLYEFLEERGARVVFNETQRQFSLPYPELDLTDAYLAFTYPYDVFARIEDIRAEIARRGISGIIHYVQSFCFRQMEDLILRKSLGVPVLTLEGDKPGPIDGRTSTRLESFLEML